MENVNKEKILIQQRRNKANELCEKLVERIVKNNKLMLEDVEEHFKIMSEDQIKHFKESYDLKKINELRGIVFLIKCFGSKNTFSFFSKIFPDYLGSKIYGWEEISNELDKINKEGIIYLNKLTLYEIWALYHCNNIMFDLANKLTNQKKHKEYLRNQGYIALENYKKRKDSKSTTKNEFDQFARELEEMADEYIRNDLYSEQEYKDGLDLLRKRLLGRYDSEIKDLFFLSIDKKGISNRKKGIILFDLFRLILVKRDWMDEEEFINKENFADSLEYDTAPKYKNYDDYKAKTFSKFILKK